MRYLNDSGGDLLVHQENGGGGSILIKKDAYFDGSSTYAKYAVVGLRRLTDGTPLDPVPAADPLVIVLGQMVVENGMMATTADVAAFPAAGIIAGTMYTMWGKISWNDGIADREADFSFIGGLTGGPGSFTFEVVMGAATAPVAGSSTLDIRDGTMSIAWSGGAPVGDVSLTIIHDFAFIDPSAHYGTTYDNLLNSPNTKEVTTYVHLSDEATDPLNYVAGSAGQIKFIRVFYRGAKVGDRLKVTRFRYRDPLVPKEVTHQDIYDDVVTMADLS
jgi:hypothetical protein